VLRDLNDPGIVSRRTIRNGQHSLKWGSDYLADIIELKPTDGDQRAALVSLPDPTLS
jgi:hypothetical protein